MLHGRSRRWSWRRRREDPASIDEEVHPDPLRLTCLCGDLAFSRERGGGGTEDVLSFLAKSELFGALNAEEQRLLADRFEPVTIQGGEILMHEGDPADGIYLVHSGRLQARLGPDDQPTVIGEVGRGEVVGEAALLTDRPRGATVVALRDSLLLRLTVEAFEELLARSPMLLRPIAGQVIERLRMATAGEDSARPVATITAVTLHEGSRCRRFQEALATELAVAEPSLAVVAAVDVPQGPSVTAWLNALEHEHDLVLYLADADDDDWTRRCLRQADVVILVADGDREPAPTPVEEVLAEHRRRVPLPVELVLVHPPHIEVPDWHPSMADEPGPPSSPPRARGRDWRRRPGRPAPDQPRRGPGAHRRRGPGHGGDRGHPGHGRAGHTDRRRRRDQRRVSGRRRLRPRVAHRGRGQGDPEGHGRASRTPST